MSNLWTLPTGVSLGTLAERTPTTIALPLNTVDSVTLIAGALPGGLRLSNFTLVGTPLEVSRITQSRFVLRAQLGTDIQDRTFSITVAGADDPVWITPSGQLPVGNNNTFFVLDSSYVDYQLTAIDTDISAGDELQYFIASGDGELPPGIKLSAKGKLFGVIDPILALDINGSTGAYDTNTYGAYPFDFGLRSANGFESFYYDVQFYDYSISTRSPRKLNRYYEFTVSVSDGDSIAKRTFRIFVVGDDFLRADNTILQLGSGIFASDGTYIRTPQWLTPRDLGYRRANNYVTLYLELYDPNTITGYVAYTLRPTNDDATVSTLPPGCTLDSTSGEVAGRVPYQPAVTKEYKFTVRATRFGANNESLAIKDKTFVVKILGEVDSVITWNTDSDLNSINANFISTLSVNASTTVPNGVLRYVLTAGALPNGLTLALDGEILGKVQQFGENRYNGLWNSGRAYEINDVVKFAGNLYKCIQAHTSSTFATNLINWQIYTFAQSGLTIFDNKDFTLDGSTTSIDKRFIFTVEARDQFGYSAITKIFTITVIAVSDLLYSNLYVKPFLPSAQRSSYQNLISDPNIFDPAKIYRPNDPLFGLQKQLKMLIYAGIETKTINHYVTATATNHRRKRYQFGEVKTAVAKNPGTNDIVYEVLYVEMIDPLDDASRSVENKIIIKNNNSIKVDQTNIEVLDDVTRLNVGGTSYTIFSNNNLPLAVGAIGTNLQIYARSGSLIFNTGTTYQPGTLSVILQNGSTIIVGNVITSPSDPFRFRPNQPVIKVDSTVLNMANSKDIERYISNTTNMRAKISALGATENEFLPLWMRTPQANLQQLLGFVLAVPLCYCKPNTSQSILLSFKNSGYNFNNINYEIDRYIVDSTTGLAAEQYIMFPNYHYNI